MSKKERNIGDFTANYNIVTRCIEIIDRKERKWRNVELEVILEMLLDINIKKENYED